MADKQVNVIFNLIDRASAGMKGIMGSAIGVGAQFAIASKALDLLQATIVSTITDWAKFETKMVDVGNLSGATTEQVGQISKQLLNVAREIPVPLQDLADGLFDVASAGIGANDQIAFLKTASTLAVAGCTDTKTAVDGLTSIMNAYGLTAKDANMISDKFFAAQVVGKTTVGELASTLGGLAPIANAAGVSLDEMMASVSALTTQGIRTSEAVTGVRQAIANTLKPSIQAADLAKALGLEFNNQALEAKGLSGFLKDVIEKTGGQTDQLSVLFGSVEATNAVLALASQEFKGLDGAMKAVQNSTDATTKAFDKQMNTLSSQWTLFVNHIKTALMGLMAWLGPYLTGFFDAINKVFTKIEKMVGLTGLQAENQLKSLTKKTEEETKKQSDTVVKAGQKTVEQIMQQQKDRIAQQKELEKQEREEKEKQEKEDEKKRKEAAEQKKKDDEAAYQAEIALDMQRADARMTLLEERGRAEVAEFEKTALLKKEADAKAVSDMQEKYSQYYGKLKSYLETHKDEENNVWNAIKSSMLDIVRDGLKQRIAAAATTASAEATLAGLAAAGPTLGGSLLVAAAQVTAISAGAAVAMAALDSIKAAEGGIIPARKGGTLVTVGEGGQSEAIIPLSKMGQVGTGGRERVMILDASGLKPLAKLVYQTQTQMLQTGELRERV